MPTGWELRKHGGPIKKENKLMDSDEKSIWESTFADIKGSPWSELGCCALGIIVMLGLNILITLGIVNLTYGSIATEGHEQLTFIVTLGYEALILFLSGLMFLKRPAIGFVVFIVLLPVVTQTHYASLECSTKRSVLQ